ncbi:MAG: T9SS type A sorting domain-containing protein [Bacteroidota bacterium]
MIIAGILLSLFSQAISISDFDHSILENRLEFEFRIASEEPIDSVSISYSSYKGIIPVFDSKNGLFTAGIDLDPGKELTNELLTIFVRNVSGLYEEESFLIKVKTDFFLSINGIRDDESFPRTFIVNDSLTFSGYCDFGCTINISKENMGQIVSSSDSISYTFYNTFEGGGFESFRLQINDGSDLETLSFELIYKPKDIFAISDVIDISDKYIVRAEDSFENLRFVYKALQVYDRNTLDIVGRTKSQFMNDEDLNDEHPIVVFDSVIVGFGAIRYSERLMVAHFFDDDEYNLSPRLQRFFFSENREFVSIRGVIQKASERLVYPEKINAANRQNDYDGIDDFGNLAQVFKDNDQRSILRVKNLEEVTFLLTDSTKTKTFSIPKVYDENLVFSEYSSLTEKYYIVAMIDGQEFVIDSSETVYGEFDYAIERNSIYYIKTDTFGNNNLYSFSENSGSLQLTTFGTFELLLVNINSHEQAVVYSPENHRYYFIDDSSIEEIVFEEEQNIKFFESTEDYYFYSDRILEIRPKSSITSNESKRDEDVQIPDVFSLEHAYPNPFNPQTNIKFTLSKSLTLNLRVYNSLGQLVSTVIDRQYFAKGSHTALFNASYLPSGLYFYTLSSEEHSITKKMVLVK